MNYIELINRFWIADIEKAFTPSDTRLYLYLLHTCNKLAWKIPFGQSDRHLSVMLGMTVSTVREAKNRLKQRGLIDFKVPEKASKSIEGQTKYSFPTVLKNSTDTSTDTNTDTSTDTSTDTNTETNTDTITNNKLNQTKQNNKEKIKKENLDFENYKNSDFENYENWIKENCTYCSNPKNLTQLSEKEFLSLKQNYTSEQISDTLLQIENRKDLRKRYSNLYRTLLNWLKTNYDEK